MTDLATLITERDALNHQIKLIEEGVRKGAEAASYSSQLITINEQRKAEGKRQISRAEFSSGLLMDEDQTP